MVSISACAIMKNEAANLPRWLASVKAFADEIIVVDTGSSDNSREIAAKAGVRVFDFKWIDDFSAAKNFALEQALGAWIAFPDIDEFFDEVSQKKIRKLLENLDSKTDIKGVTCPLYNIDVDDGDKLLSIVVQLRLFRNSSCLRYEGSVHETIGRLGQENVYYTQDLRIVHTGYSAHQQRKKSERNLRMLLNRQTKGENPFDWHYIMDCCYGLGDYKKTVEYARKILSCGILPESDRKAAWENWASSLLKEKAPLPEILKILDRGKKEYPSFNRLQAMKGLCLYEAELYEEAEPVLRQTLQMEKELAAQGRDRSVKDGAGRHLPYVHSCLGLMACNKGREDEALVELLESLKLNRFQPNILLLFLFLLEKRRIEAVDQIEILNNLYDVSRERTFLVNTLEKNGGKMWIYYKNKESIMVDEKSPS